MIFGSQSALEQMTAPLISLLHPEALEEVEIGVYEQSLDGLKGQSADLVRKTERQQPWNTGL